MAANIGYKISGKHDTKGIDGAKKSINDFAKDASAKINSFTKEVGKSTNGFTLLFKSIGNFEKAMPAIGAATYVFGKVIGSIKKVKAAIDDCVSAFAEDEAAALKVNFAVKINKQLKSSSFELKTYFANLSAATKNYYSEAELMNSASEILMDKTAEQIKNIMSAAVNLSAATGGDLKSSVEELNKTYTGTVGKLATIYPELKNLTAEELEQGAAVEIVRKKTEGYATALSGTVAASLKEAKNASEDLKSAWGQMFAAMNTPLRNWWTEQISGAAALLKYFNDIRAAKEGISNPAATSDSYLTQIKSLREQIKTLRDMNAAGGNDFASRHSVNVNNKKITDLNNQIQALIPLYNASLAAENKATEATKKSTEATKKSTETTKKGIAQAEKSITFSVFDTPQPIQQPLQQTVNLSNPFALGDIADTKINDALNGMKTDVKATFDDMKESAKEASPAFQNLSNMMSQLGEVGQIVSSIMEHNIIGLIISLIAKLASALSEKSANFEKFMNGITEIMGTVADILAPIMDKFIKPFVETFKPIGEILGSILSVIFTILNNVLAPINKQMTLTIRIAAPIISVFSKIMNLFSNLSPIMMIFTATIEGMTRIIEWGYNKILKPICNFIIACFIGLYNGIYKVFKAISLPTGISISRRGISVKWKSLANILDMSEKDQDDYTLHDLDTDESTDDTTSSDSSSSSSSASYTAAKDVYVSIYFNNSYVNGDARQIAIMLQKEIKSAEKLGYV